MSQPTVRRDGWYNECRTYERYVCEGDGRAGHGPTARSAYVFWWLAENPWPPNRSGRFKKLMPDIEEAIGGVYGYHRVGHKFFKDLDL